MKLLHHSLSPSAPEEQVGHPLPTGGIWRPRRGNDGALRLEDHSRRSPLLLEAAVGRSAKASGRSTLSVGECQSCTNRREARTPQCGNGRFHAAAAKGGAVCSSGDRGYWMENSPSAASLHPPVSRKSLFSSCSLPVRHYLFPSSTTFRITKHDSFADIAAIARSDSLTAMALHPRTTQDSQCSDS